MAQPDESGDSVFHDPAPFAAQAQGHTLCFLPSGRDRLERLVSLIDAASHNLRLCFYIFAEDSAGQRVRDALVSAATRGVQVTLIIDGFGAAAADAFFAPFVECGGTFQRFSANWSRRYLIRNHQKIVLVDGQTAMLGGFNIEDAYFDPPARGGWHDLGLVIEGPVVDQLNRWFEELEDWVNRPRAQFWSILKKVREWNPGAGPVQLLIGGPTRGLSSWARSVGRDLAEGRQLDLIMAYFSPSKSLLGRIGAIANRGQALLVTAGQSDNAATIGATRSLYHYLLQQGAEIHEFDSGKLHMKLIVVDDAVYVGSANLDMRSLYLNLEVMLRIEDAALAERMRAFIALHLPASTAITPTLHRRRATLWNRVRWNLSWFLVSVIDYTVSRRLNLGLK